MSVPPEVAEAIIEAGRRLDRFGWVPATAGNFSMRLDERRLAVTVSGRHKGFLTADDVMVVDLDGVAEDPTKRSSAETLLHCGIYRRFPQIGAVLHAHSVPNTVLSLGLGNGITLTGYELLKAFPGLPARNAAVTVPVVDNDQDISRMARGLEALWTHMTAIPPGYLIRGHGCYVWAADMPGALMRLEALEFMLACELERRGAAR